MVMMELRILVSILEVQANEDIAPTYFYPSSLPISFLHSYEVDNHWVPNSDCLEKKIESCEEKWLFRNMKVFDVCIIISFTGQLQGNSYAYI